MKPTIFCLTPTKNEEWIIERFLKAASIWADKIIISDQGSTDRTIEIAKQFPKVTIIDNSQLKDFNEQEMRAPLFNEARKNSGEKLLISLDADEIFTPNFDSPEWETMLNAKAGTRFVFNWYHVNDDFKQTFTTVENPCAFIDDNSKYNVGLIHVPRQPVKEDVLHIKLNDIAILHLQFTNWGRMERKHIWYQMYERIHYPSKSAIRIYRAYHYNKTFTPLPGMKEQLFNPQWIDGYKAHRIDITSVNRLPNYPWDQIIINYINTYSIDYFRHIDLGNVDWKGRANNNIILDLSKFKSHSTFIDKLLLTYLRRTHHKRLHLYVRVIDKILKFFF